MAFNYFDLFKLLASTGVGIYSANQQKKNNLSNVGITSGIANNAKLPKFKYNSEPVEERNDTGRRPGSSGRRYLTDANYTDEAGNVVEGLVSGNQNGIGGGNPITQEQAESQGVNALGIAKGVALGYIIPKVASAAYTGIKAGIASGSVAAGAKAALAKLGIGAGKTIANSAAAGNTLSGGGTIMYDMAGMPYMSNAGIAGANAGAGTTTANVVTPTLNTGFGGLGTGNLGLGAQGSALSSAAGGALMAAILAKGAFGMPSGKANIEKIAKERQDKIIKEKINPFTGMMAAMSGMSNADLLASQRPPQTPWEAEQAYIRGNELGSYRGQGTGGGGDQDYEVDSARQQWEMNPERDRINQEFLAQGDNAKYYNPDMSRTNYMGKVYENNAGLTALANASRDFNAGITNVNPTQTAVAQYQEFMKDPNNSGKQFQYTPNSKKETQPMNAGGIVGNNPNPNGYFLGGITDGMTDEIPANIDGEQEAALSDGEFVIPADVVSHFGNGNSNAGADKLQDMMQDVRKARTGNKNQGIQINPDEYLLRT